MLESGELDHRKTSSEMEWLYNNLPIHWKYTSKNIDRMSRRLFPLLFLIFNIVYWPVYTAESRKKEHPSE